MKKSVIVTIIIAITLLFTQLACANLGNIELPKLTTGSGTIATDTRSVKDFDQIELNGAGEMIIIQGSTEALVIEAEDNIIDNITSEVVNGRLEIGYDADSWLDRILPTRPIKYTITVKELERLEINGAVQLKNDMLNVESFELIINGAGQFDFDFLTAEYLEVDISGGASVKMAGAVEDQDVVINGAGNYDAEDLATKNTEITFNGAGNASVWATDTLDMNINGAGNIDYYGTPQVSQSITGLGNISHKGDK